MGSSFLQEFIPGEKRPVNKENKASLREKQQTTRGENKRGKFPCSLPEKGIKNRTRNRALKKEHG